MKLNDETHQPDAIQIDWNDLSKAGKFNAIELKKFKELGYIEITLRMNCPQGYSVKKRVSYFRVYTKGKKLW